MRKTIKKLTAVGLVLTTVAGLAACGTAKTAEMPKKTEVTKPDKIKVMVDGTVVTETNGGLEFRKQLAELTGLNIEWTQPDHSGYYDAVANAFNSNETMPDVCILSSDYYSSYASNGLLWDMTDAWKNSKTKNSGRLVSTADNVINSLMVNGGDGKQALYGFATGHGNGCLTYIKEQWLKDSGISVSEVKDKVLSFSEYYSILKKMHEVKGKPAIIAPGYVSADAPYTNYLPEFYQQAQFSFYKDSSGKYVDGFSTQAMKEALARIATAVKDGVIDKETLNSTTSNCRDKFYGDETGVFTYWAGTWAETLRSSLATKGLNDSLIAIKPIKELGTYVERLSPVWAITTHAQNPEGVFKYFIDTMLDGGDIQMAWTYGAKGTHWDTKAETVTIKGAENKGVTYTEGQFHFLPSPEKPSGLQTKNNIDPLTCIAKFTNGDPGQASVAKLALENNEFFANNSTVAVAVPRTEEFGDNIGDINTQRKNIVAKVVSGELTADQGITEYNKNVGGLVKEVLDSLNKVK